MGGISLGAAVVATISYFIRLETEFALELEQKRWKEEENEFAKVGKYDFIIVGAGLAGCLLANRLSEKFNVLLLEEGGPAPSLTQPMGFRPFVTSIRELNTVYTTVPQIYADNKILKHALGRMMGGSNSGNQRIYNRGHPRDYELWAKLTKSNEWKYENVLPIFKALESYSGPFPSDQRGTKGPMGVDTENMPILRYFKAAAKELGLVYGDSNGPQREEMSPIDFTRWEGRGLTTCWVFIDPIIGIRKTLTVVKYAEVTQILFKLKTATGVEFTKFGKQYRVFAKNEIILSAGAFGSPMLLFKSGIGPSEMLSKAKIKNVVDLPVGRNLENHILLPILYSIGNKNNFVTTYYDLKEQNFQTYLKGENDGILSDEGEGPQVFFASTVAKGAGEKDWPDVRVFESTPILDDNKVVTGVMFSGAQRAKSIGSVTLNVTAYLAGERRKSELAIIDYKLLQNKDDRQLLIEGVHKLVQILNTNALKPLGLDIQVDRACAQKGGGGLFEFPNLWPITPSSDDAYWKCFTEKWSTLGHHDVGTCRMGYGPTDQNSVVDTQFRVLGTQRLRIVDASTFPKITNANIYAPTMLIAEVAAKKILDAYNNKNKGGKVENGLDFGRST